MLVMSDVDNVVTTLSGTGRPQPQLKDLRILWEEVDQIVVNPVRRSETQRWQRLTNARCRFRGRRTVVTARIHNTSEQLGGPL